MVDSIRQQIIDKLDTLFKTILTSSQVIGTDTLNYTCKLDHMAASDKRPITGANWATYWTQTGSSGVAWVTGSSYVVKTYKTDLGNNIFAWRKTPLQGTELPALVYRDRVETKEPGWGIYENKLQLEIEIFANTPAEIRECIADLEVAVFKDETWGGLALQSELDVNEMEIEQKEDIFVASKIILNIHYRTVIGDPYTEG